MSGEAPDRASDASAAADPLANAVAELLQTRRSVRGFLAEEVPTETLRHIFSLAQRAPSNCNTQPWRVHVVSGGTAQRLADALEAAAAADVPAAPDFSRAAYEGEYRTRQIEAAKALLGAQAVAREDMEGRRRSFLRNFRFFGAPHAAFLFMPDWCGVPEAVDCGIYAQSLMLALTAHGLGSCAQGSLSGYPAIVRRHLGISEDQKLLFGIAFGYEDATHVANQAQVGRADVDLSVTFHS